MLGAFSLEPALGQGLARIFHESSNTAAGDSNALATNTYEICGLAAPTVAPEAQPGLAECTDPAWRQAVADIAEISDAANVAGFALLVVDAQRPRCAAYVGLADRASGRPVDAQTWFRVGSIAKSFTALTALRMAEQGEIVLDAPLRESLGELSPPNPWAEQRVLTLAQLLQHSGGLTDMSRLEFDYPNQGELSLAEALAIRPQSRRLRWPPGQHTAYSNSGAGLVGLALEQVAGASFEALAQQQVLDPLDMTEASFLRSAEVVRHLATGYNRDGASPIEYWHIIYRPAAALNLRPAAMRPFLQMLLRLGDTDNGRFLSADSMRLLEDPSDTLAARSGLRFGRGMGNYHYQYRGYSFHGHGGDADGYLAHYAYSKEAELAFFLVINAFQPPTLRRMRERVQAQIVADLPAPTFPPELQLPPAELQAMAGSYVELTRRFGGPPARIRLQQRSGRLYSIDSDGDRMPMLAVTNQHFRRPWQSVATMALLQDENGRWVLQGEMGNYGKVPVSQD